MKINKLAAGLSVSPQIVAADLPAIRDAGFRTIVCNQADGESADQPTFAEIAAAAARVGIAVHYLPVEAGNVDDEQGAEFRALVATLDAPVLAYCRTGIRSATLWALSQAGARPLRDIVAAGEAAGYDLSGVARRIAQRGRPASDTAVASHDVVIVGAGAAGLAVASSLLARDPTLDVAVIDPADAHYYQPGWTMVGAGVFQPQATARRMAAVLPRGVHWIKAGVAAFEPLNNAVLLEACRVVRYRQLVVCPGLKLDWHAIEGLPETLGKNGVTSNYRYDLAPYTWQLVSEFGGRRALFTQPPLPIKCTGAPQKAMYLSADHWQRTRRLDKVDVAFYSASPTLFGVPAYVPALMEYVKRYDIALNFSHNLIAIDGPGRRAAFLHTRGDGSTEIVTRAFDMIHVVPPQKAPDFVRASPLADVAGWVDVDPATLRHRAYPNIYALGDAANTPNAKTAAAARKQAPVVAHNVLAALGRAHGEAAYDGYGSCPLTVERGKIVLAEFRYGGRLAPTFPAWLIDGTRPSRLAWLLKERLLPPLYWQAMLKGREWLAQPEIVG
ncbi:bifunctional protein tyrosine phosphatase family protein/NAD(P)/FAD-dependent oxidoreductase [Burkholderia oklahomensis]|uniref:bifunctional protein tyrosine phosphatase family protein/NAD(P)/FAD-dependent oxidoreductase n=3 Tax=Burkholderia oklahomensis TaxID=342113 RepID=UPI0005D902FC|nr:bifunctional protein tyrosine phosphatase family protein/NAD(P)/FAD-dependent oxidoreductase [Burkholderia oklahomensis]AJX33612.1 FAD dependent oxidoreductase family protein [Burkholderia oklahomensis C6786]AOI45885.1 NAD(FAD)-dependent dehydrogenase [Burkholderia oklahomensis C6786]KUY52864.1 NAD(FAD)-dependent dehydrogenase [Burkholderia oklahomensis C6786]MBI0361570.1 TIGR01244 family phosphatase [Burkholderia oklahomensis]SUW55668.1 Sulfide dehydrogenase [flavocytochrome c] flavoprotei